MCSCEDSRYRRYGHDRSAIAEAFDSEHEILRASHTRSALAVDLGDPDSIRRLYADAGVVDAVVRAAGDSVFRPLFDLSDADFALCINNKLMGQVNLIRFGVELLSDGGSFTLTTGILSRRPIPGTAAIAIANAGLEGFVRAAA